MEKNIFCSYLYPFNGLIKNSYLNQSKFSSGFATFKHGKKTNFLSISVLVSEIVNFMSKKKSSLLISPKMLQSNRKAWFRSMWLTLWRKKKLLIFIPFYWFEPKKLLKQIINLLIICPFRT